MAKRPRRAVRHPRGADELAQAKAVGERLKREAKGYPGGITAFQKALHQAGVPGVSSRKELYQIFAGDPLPADELFEVAARLLEVRREWLRTGAGEREHTEAPWPAGIGAQRLAPFREELRTALSAVVSPARASRLAQDVVDYTSGSLSLMDLLPGETVAHELAELCRVAPWLEKTAFGRISYLASVAQALLDLSFAHAAMFRRITPNGKPNTPAEELSWKVLRQSLLTAAQYEAERRSPQKGRL